MRFLLALIWVAAVVAVAPTLALGAKPEHAYHSESFTVPDFCGTGTSVDGFFESIFTASERDGLIKVEHQGSFTFSYGDASVIVSFAGQFTHTLGMETASSSRKGSQRRSSFGMGPSSRATRA
jgi:hypothetical protein